MNFIIKKTFCYEPLAEALSKITIKDYKKQHATNQ